MALRELSPNGTLYVECTTCGTMVENDATQHCPPSFDEYLDVIRRNFAVLSSSWNAKEKEASRTVARIACEQLAQFLADY